MDENTILQKAILSNIISNVRTALQETKNPAITWAKGMNILHYYVTVAPKLTYNHSDLIDLFLKFGIDVNSKNNEGNTPLHYAVSRKNSELVQTLLRKGAEVDIQDVNGNTPLWRAVMDYRGEKELLDVITTLINHNASPDKENNYGKSPRKIVLERHRDTPLVNQPVSWDLQPLLQW